MAPHMNDPEQILDAGSSPDLSNDDRRRKKWWQRRGPKVQDSTQTFTVTDPTDIVVGGREGSHGKAVSFSPLIRYKQMKHINDYSDEEFFATWLVEDELRGILKQCAQTVKMMVRGEPVVEADGFCSRGLEYKTPVGSRGRKENKSKAMKAVLAEQQRQRAKGVWQPKRLSKIYREVSNHPRRTARLMAVKDEEAAMPLLQTKSSIVLMRRDQDRHLPTRALTFTSMYSDKDKADKSTIPTRRREGETAEEEFRNRISEVVDELDQSWKGLTLRSPATQKKHEIHANDSGSRRVAFGQIDLVGH